MSDNDATQMRQDDATKQLRAMLDERGVEWKDYGYENHTWWNDGENVGWHAENRPSVRGSYVKIEAVLTPRQAIAATLGAGTCTLINAADDLGSGTSSCMCFECGYTALDDWWEEFNFCPNCGRRIEVTE